MNLWRGGAKQKDKLLHAMQSDGLACRYKRLVGQITDNQ
jgi:hypothetical protein